MKRRSNLAELRIFLPVRVANRLRQAIAPANLESLISTAIHNELLERDRKHKNLVKALEELRRHPVTWSLPIPGKTHLNSGNTDSVKLIRMLRKHDDRLRERKLARSLGSNLKKVAPRKTKSRTSER